MAPGKENTENIGCCVIITVKNDAVNLQKTLASLDAQSRAPDECILAVANSRDNTLEVAQSWSQQSRGRGVLPVGTASRSLGRNLAAKQTRQDILLFTDAGCFPDKDWVQEMLKPFIQQETELVSGYTQGQNDSAFTEAQAAFVLVPLGKIGKHPLPATRNMAITRALFLKMKGFNPTLNFAEDYEFARRLVAADYQSLFVRQAVVHWEPRATIVEFFQMISRLTQGDMVAATWRLGHFTMWLRYLLFLEIWLFDSLTSSSLLRGLLITSFFYAGYLLLKLSRFRFSRPGSYFWAILLQVVTDMAVLQGSFVGMLHKFLSKERRHQQRE